MRRFALLVGLGQLLVGVCGALAAPPANERGRYLVEQVGMCADCHSPRGPTGAVVTGMELAGAPIGFAPKHPMPAWAEHAPRLAGLPPGYDEVSLARFLQTGTRPDGTMARPPMPSYRLERGDADAVAAYLKSLAP